MFDNVDLTGLTDKELSQLEDILVNEMVKKARENFYTFVQLMAPYVLPGDNFIKGRHIELISNELERVCRSVEADDHNPERLQIMLPPGSMKSKLASNLFPAWCLGRNPHWFFLAIGADQEFAIDNFGRPTKEIIDSDAYHKIFPNTVLKRNVKSAGRWDTTKRGRFVAKGVGQGIAGRRAHISLCDDVITEQTSMAEVKEINTWYLSGLRTRLLPSGGEIIINTRWFVEDLSGYMIKLDSRSERPWREVRIPAILTLEASQYMRNGLRQDTPLYKVGTSFWPEFWPLEVLLEKKAVYPPSIWAALYMQTPILEEGGIIKQTDWKVWSEDKPPKNLGYIVVSMDTGYSAKETSDYSAYTVWGGFQHTVKTPENIEMVHDCMILLAAERGRWDFDELCKKAEEVDTKYTPEYFIIESKGSGQILIQEMQKRDIPVVPYRPERDKSVRLQGCVPYFRSGRIWVPQWYWNDEGQKVKKWAEDVVDEVCNFQPKLRNQVDDYTDTVSQAILWMRDRYKIDNDGFTNQWEQSFTGKGPKTYWASVNNKRSLN